MNRRSLCGQCGAALPTEAQFCSGCGHAVDGSVTPVSPAVTHGPCVCPKCEKSDGVQTAENALERLKTVPEKEDPTDEEFEEQIRREELIECLSRPEKPELFSFWLWAGYMLIPLVNLVAVFAAPLRKGPRIFMAIIGITFIGLVLWSSTGTFDDPFYPKNITGLFGFIMALLYWILLYMSWLARRRELAGITQAHDRAIRRWGHLYYCYSCNLVFLDDVPDSSAPVEKGKVAYSVLIM